MGVKFSVVIGMAVCSGIAMAQPMPTGPVMGGPRGPYPSASPYRGAPMGSYQGPSYMGSPSGSGPVSPTRFAPYSGPSRMPSTYSGPSMNSGPISSGPGLENSRNSRNEGPPVMRMESRTPDMKPISPDLSPQDRMKIPLIDYKYRQGLNNYNDGSSSRDEFKMRMGIQQMDDANENIGRLKPDSPQGNRGSENRGGGRGQRNR